MKNRLSIILGLISIPLLLVLFCGFIILTTGLMGWWLWGQEEDSNLIRIDPLRPLATSEVGNAQPEGLAQPQTNEAGAAPAAPPKGQAGAVTEAVPPAA